MTDVLLLLLFSIFQKFFYINLNNQIKKNLNIKKNLLHLSIIYSNYNFLLNDFFNRLEKKVNYSVSIQRSEVIETK